ncbi:MAG: FecR domain-containing protein [Nitratireductor sp.]
MNSFSDFIRNLMVHSLVSPRMLASVLVFLCGFGQGFAADKVGEASSIKNVVTGSATGKLAVSDPVFASERISADAGSHGELRLNDDSLVIVGENSSISLDDFVVSQGGFKNATVKVAKGAFRFITGNSPKKAFKVKTPLSTIGVRGTVFDVYVDEGSGITRVVLLRGAVTVCSQGSACLVADRTCDVIEVKSRREIQKLPFLRSARRSRAEERAQYALTEQQNRFQRRWRAPTASCNARAAQEAMDTRNQSSNGNGIQDSVVIPEIETYECYSNPYSGGCL